MPLNPPTAIDRRGLTPLANYDGSRASAWPQGDKPQGEVPAAITGLAASPGPEQANLSWTPNGSMIKLYRRDDTAAGSFQLVTDQISGSASTYADQGLIGGNDYSYKMVAYNQYGDAPDSNIASVTTGAALGDAYQLAAGQYAPSRFPLQWVNPNGDETSRSAFLWSHSQFDYVRRVTVSGGAPPYYFYLDSPVAGVTFERQAPSWNPYLFLWADLIIDHTQFTSGSKVIPLRCIDQEGTLLSLSLTVTVDDSKFVVMQDATGSSSGVGTLADPYEDLGDIYGTSETDGTHADKIIVGRSGNYLIDNFDASNSAMQWNEHKPSGWIPYPGESMSFTVNANTNVRHTSGTLLDCYFGEATYNGGDETSSNARTFVNTGDHKRLVWDHPNFVNPVVGTSGTDNTSCIFFASSSGLAAHTELSIIDGLWDGLPASTNGVSMFDVYGGDNVAVVGGRLINSVTRYGAWLKSQNNHFMVAGLDCYDTSNTETGRLFNGDNNQYEGDPILLIQFVGCRGYREEDGLQSDAVVYFGEGGLSWGYVYADRMTIVGRNQVVNSGAVDSEAFMEGCIVINDQPAQISSGFTQTDNLSDSRSNIGSYLTVGGDVLSSHPRYGEVGANFVAPGGA